jgi:benzoyl-CoA reductase subunit C
MNSGQINSRDLITRAEMNEDYIRQLKSETKKPVIGYLCCFAPPEIISAAGAIPFRITGVPGKDTSSADAYVEPYGCTYVRNILARAAEGELDYLDGLIISHSCDMVQRLYGIWTYNMPFKYSYMFNVPHQVTPWGKRFFQRELVFFQESIERFTGINAHKEALQEMIVKYNDNRSTIRSLYELRKGKGPLIEGSEIMDLLVAGGALSNDDFSTLLLNTLDHARQRSNSEDKRPRVMVWGSIMDDPALYQMIEEAGAAVVADDTCIGFRTWEQDVPLTDNLYTGLTEHYFINFQCPRTDRGPGTERFAYILDRAREYGVEGIIGYCISFCDPHKFDYPDLRDYLKKEGLPMLLLDDNYSFEPAEAIKTRLQAFIEML